MEDIAVVGIGLRFPGDASCPEELWKVLERGESQWTEFPKDRLNIDGYYHPGGDRQGSISFRGAHFLNGNVAAFDASFFSVPAEDAKSIDPQQRMLLETTYEAIENAGLRKEDIDGSDAAVYVGSFVKDYEQVCLRDPDWQPQYAATGNGIAIMANRISYFFNLHGPSMTIDTGCSGSLVSIHLAAQSLRTGETSLAIAAGAGLILTPNTIMPMTALNFLSPDGKCFTFDARANGYGRGEGIGVVVMKRLSDALKDNDTIRAVIRGTRVNQDGHTTGITLPSKEAQVANIRSLYESVGLDFNQTGYVECHGTGTQAGDWRELKAISESLGSVRTTDNPIVVGSIKPNIGHLEGAAGVAGMIKGILTLENGKIPPNINFETGNPDIHFKEWRVKVPLKMMDWPLPGLRRVSVNCFGFGGTNAHVILDEAPRYLSARGLKGHHNSLDTRSTVDEVRQTKDLDTSSQPQLFCYSSNERAGVRRIIQSHIEYLKSKEDNNSSNFLVDYAYTLGCRRSEMEWRHTVVATSRQSLISSLQNCTETSFSRTSKGKKPGLCFLFCGQGAQYPQMGESLLMFEPFRRSIQDASTYMKEVLASPFDLLDEILRPSEMSRISQPEISQPATTALQIALVELFASFNIKPKCVIGHSSGEAAAAFAAGALSREAAWEVAYYRGLASFRVSQKRPGLKGGMIVVGMPLQKVEQYLQAAANEVDVACINSPRSVTISGAAKTIYRIANDLSRKKIFHRVLSVQVAYHSSHMKLVEEEYTEMLANIHPNPAQEATMISTVTGGRIMYSCLDAHYWSNNMVSPVRYLDAVRSLFHLPADEQPDMFVELSPSGTLRSPTSDILTNTHTIKNAPPYHSAIDGRSNDVASLLEVIGQLWAQGYPLNMRQVVSKGASQPQLKCLVDLPPYPWYHDKSYWHESHLGRANRFRKFGRQDLIGAPTADAISFEPRWRGFLRISENPWIQDHQVQKTIVYPAAGMVTMALEGACQLVDDKSEVLGYEITNMRIEKAMIIPNTSHGLETAMNFKQNPTSGTGRYKNLAFEFTIYSKYLDGPWEQHCSGLLQIRYQDDNSKSMFQSLRGQYETLKDRCVTSVKPRQLYELLDVTGMNYGPLFRNIVEISTGGNSCITRVQTPDIRSKMPGKFEYPHLIHPATLDSIFQSLFAIDHKPMVPTYIDSLFISANISRAPEHDFIGFATAQRNGISNADADISVTQKDWNLPSIVIRGLHFAGLSTSSPTSNKFLPNHRNLCTEIVWAEDYTLSTSRDLREVIKLMAHKYGGLSILQIGSDHILTLDILETCTPIPNQASCLSRYTVATSTCEKEEVLSHIKDTIYGDYVETRTIDSSEPLPQYHLILATGDHQINLSSLLPHLYPMGLVVSLRCDPRVTETEWLTKYHYKLGGEDIHTFSHEYIPHHRYLEHGVMILLSNNPPLETVRLAANIRDNIMGLHSTPHVTMYADEIPSNLGLIRSNTVISLLDFSDSWRPGYSIFQWTKKDFDAFHVLQKTAKGILWVTKAAHLRPKDPNVSPIVGLARTLMSEDPLKTIVTLDLGSDSKLYDPRTARSIIQVFNRIFAETADVFPLDMEYAEENGTIFVPRLVPIESLNSLVENDQSNKTVSTSFQSPKTRLKLEFLRPGLQPDNLRFSTADEKKPSNDEVEVVFDCAFVTSHDLDIVMGRSTERNVGIDLIGIIGTTGDNVSGFAKNERVAAIVPDGAFQNRRNIDSRFVRPWAFELPLSHYVASCYALRHIGRLRRGRSVLIHAGASSFGLAAIHVASKLGGEIFATVMGSNTSQQRDVIEKSGIDSDHILDAQSNSFVRVIKDLTGKGVDVVYNCTQQHVEANFDSVCNGGAIIQYANKSACQPDTRISNPPASFISLDFLQLLRDDPDYVAKLLDETMKFLKGSETVLTRYAGSVLNVELSHIMDGLREVEKDPYLGLVRITAGPSLETMVNVAAQQTTKSLREALSPDGTYVLAGGLGGLGRSICELLVDNGAKHIAFLSRSGASSESSVRFIESLRSRGVNTRVYQVDICHSSGLFTLAHSEMRDQMPVVKGIFQCAAVIKDAVFDNMSYTDWVAAFNPKAAGTEHLVKTFSETGDNPFFIFLSSSAGVIGSRGQANYAAGNFYMDMTARSLRLKGKHAVSIDLGPVLGAGMLADDEETLDMLRASGFYGIRHQDFITMIKHAITMEITPDIPMPPQIVMGIGTGGLIRQNQPADPYWTRTALFNYMNLVDAAPDLSTDSGTSNIDMKSMLKTCTDLASASEIICIGLTHMLAKAMNMLPEELDSSKPPNVYGVDSLVAVGVRNWVISNCGVEISVFEILSEMSIKELAAMVAVKGGFRVERA